ncbi:hypothetical protein [Mycolicibacterium sp.]
MITRFEGKVAFVAGAAPAYLRSDAGRFDTEITLPVDAGLPVT